MTSWGDDGQCSHSRSLSRDRPSPEVMLVLQSCFAAGQVSNPVLTFIRAYFFVVTLAFAY
jgi:hypothetical protein